jgi:cytochrome c-type biogenesis protein
LKAYVFSHALLFVAGFTLVFVILFGIPTTLLGGFVYAQRNLVAVLGGLLIIVLGLHMAGFFKGAARLAGHTGGLWKGLGRAASGVDHALDAVILPERRWHAGQGRSPGYARSFVVGLTFAAGWTPCIGPLLGLVITLASVNPARAMPLLLAYSMGLATPFLLTALLLGSATGFLRRINRFVHVIELASGVLLVGVGILLVQGAFSQLNAYFGGTPGWMTALESGWATGAAALSFPLAFMAGLLSFLSPCVLPLVPVYLGYLSGTLVGSQAGGRQQPANSIHTWAG